MEDKNSFGSQLSTESVKVIAESIGIGEISAIHQLDVD
jgi:hypothetical protein